ncbi:1-deoxy-D-xylulose-5-phosphate synthase [Rickettsiales bacterium]|nr:1-deoxy-D-xylulose-5-phosphate synthase [Rickettsiales bacterium]
MNNKFDNINYPKDLKKLSKLQLEDFSNYLRQKTIEIVSQTGGHLGAGLGVIELTTALHYVFNTPDDKIIWDVGHQSYPHKILTGRKDKMLSIRQENGISGFTKRSESEFDPFGAGHSSTSISAALGFALARDIKKEKRDVIAVIGDGSISAGMAYEALNNAGSAHNRLIVILNDNDMSIAPPVGAMSNYLSRLAASKSYLKIRDISKKFLKKLPDSISKFPKKFEKAAKEWWMGGNIFEEMGFYYIGPVDGHNIDILVTILENIKNDNSDTPILIHVKTEKGKGYNEIMSSGDSLHAVAKFDPKTGQKEEKKNDIPSFSKVFGGFLTKLAKIDKDIVAITAAMPTGTGLDIFQKDFTNNKNRFFDVGIAEQHAVTFAAGLACEGVKPFVAIYSTFLQRAYDQIVHDVAIQNLPVRFAIDRAGFVGADGPTHAGIFDIAYLINLPNFILMAPKDGDDLARSIKTSLAINNQPSAFRFPRGNTKISNQLEDILNLNIKKIEDKLDKIKKFPIGKGKIIKKGQKIAILSLGSIINNVLAADKILQEKHNIDITIADAIFAKPFDQKLVLDLAQNHDILITIEEGSVGGFGSIIADFLLKNDILTKNNLKFYPLYVKDKFIEQKAIDKMQEEAGIGVNSIINLINKIYV